MALYANIILNNPSPEVDRIFDYEIPFELINAVMPGVRVKVPFGNKNFLTEGYCLDIKESTDVPEGKIKLVSKVMDNEPVISAEMIELAKWMKEEYFTTLSQCLKVMIPAGADLKNKELAVFINAGMDTVLREIKDTENKKSKQKQSLVLKYLLEKGEVSLSKLMKELNISRSPISTLEKNGLIKIDYRRRQHEFKNTEIKTDEQKPILNSEQKMAVEEILKGDSQKPYLIFGITGSGKTEVYISIIEELISKGKQAVVLVPEISLTPLIVGRFKNRFGERIGVTHSRMSSGERYEVWQKAKNGEISIVIGPRSAVFMPFKNLGAIIIDEEHESSYKSDSSPRYVTAEVAKKRCELNGAKLILGSATPLIESYYKAKKGEYNLICLTKRAGLGTLPRTEIVDMRKELAEGNRSIFSRRLFYAIKEKLDKKEQIMLFLNRRGYSTFVSCRKCGYVMTCSNCSVAYKYHYKGNFLMCHYCGKKINVPTVCPKCGSKYIKYFGTGTQKIEEEVRRYFPAARVLRMDFDTVAKKGSHEKILSAFAKREADILIGTQMIAKGHDFENVSLVGIMAADVSLNTGDYRGSEVTFELITQAAGRAGRGKNKGDVVIQTYQPENYAVKCAAEQNYEQFFKKECDVRKTMDYPPFSEVFTAVFVGKDENKISERITAFADILRKKRENEEIYKEIGIIGPSEAAVYKIKNEYRMTLIIKSESREKIRNFIKEGIAEYKESYRSSDVMINLYLAK